MLGWRVLGCYGARVSGRWVVRVLTCQGVRASVR